MLVILQTNLPPLTEQQQDFTSLPVSEQIIFAPKVAGIAKSAVVATVKNALFIYTAQPKIVATSYCSRSVSFARIAKFVFPLSHSTTISVFFAFRRISFARKIDIQGREFVPGV